MRSYLRLALIVAFFVAVGLLLWHLLAPIEEIPGISKTPQVPPSREPHTELPVETAREAPPAPLEATGAAIPAARESPEPTGTVRVQVLRASGEPAAGASLVLDACSYSFEPLGLRTPPSQTGVSSDSGRFEFAGLPVGSYIVSAYTDASFGAEIFEIQESMAEKEVRILLPLTATISGIVVNSSGQGIAHAAIRPLEWRDMSCSRKIKHLLTTKTEDNGAFLIKHAYHGECRFLIEADGYAPARTDFIASGTQGLRIVLTPGGALSGHIIDAATGAAVPNLELDIHQKWDTVASPVTDENGAFRVARLAPGQYVVRIISDEWRRVGSSAIVTIEEGRETKDVSIAAIRGGVLMGRFYEAQDGQGIQGLRVSVHPEHPNSAHGGSTTTAADGSYRVAGLMGQFRVQINPNTQGYIRPEKRLVTVNPGEVVEGFDFALERGLTISGKVVRTEGVAVCGAKVEADIRSTGGYEHNVISSAQSQPDGGFELSGAKSGDTLYLHAEASSREAGLEISHRQGPLIVPETGLRDLVLTVLPAASISGVVIDDDGAGLPKIRVTVASTSRIFGTCADSGTDGSFAFAGLAPDTYRIFMGSLRATAPAVDAAPVTVGPGEHLTDVILTYVTGHLTIAGRICDTRNRALAGAEINCHGPQPEGGYSRRVQSDDRGLFHIDGLIKGQYTLAAYLKGHNHVELKEIEAGSQNVNIQLAPYGLIEGRVLAEDTGEPLTTIQVTTKSEGLESFMGSPFLGTHAPDGRFSLDARKEEMIVMARAPGYLAEQQVVIVKPGQTVSGIEFRLRRGAAVIGDVTNRDGAPIAGARITADEPDRGVLAQTNEEGRFVIDAVPPSTAQLWASHPDYVAGATDVRPSTRAASRVTITLTEGGTVRGTVRVAGNPAPGRYVMLEGPLEGQQRSTRTGPDGTYSFAHLPDGTVTVRVVDTRAARPAASAPGEPSPLSAFFAPREAVVKDGMITVIDFDAAATDG